jgi:phosphate transport system protein
MDRQFAAALTEIKDKILTMGGLVEAAIENATAAFHQKNSDRVQKIFELEKKINKLHMAIDEACVRIVALHQPMAVDLRFVVACIKINADLERMGDQCVNIGRGIERFIDEKSMTELPQFKDMCIEVKLIVREALDAFMQRNSDLARSVMKRDDVVDNLKRDIFSLVATVMKQQSEMVDQGLNLIFIAKNFEKIADNATNIAEDVIYMVSGEDIRHPFQRAESSSNPKN